VKVRRAEQAVSLETERHLAGAGRSREELLSEVTGGLELASGEVNGREPVQRRKQTRRFAHPLAELASPCVDRLDLGRRVPPCRHDGRTEEHAQLELQLVALGARGLPLIGEDAVAEVLRHVAAETPDHLAAHAMRLSEDLAELFGIESLRETRRTHQSRTAFEARHAADAIRVTTGQGCKRALGAMCGRGARCAPRS
jgi:hypothetical protein